MSESLRLELPEPPSANRWWRLGRSGRRGSHAHMHLSAEARQYKGAVQLLAGSAIRPLGAARTWPVYAKRVPLEVSVWWFRSYHAGDLDKRLGVLLDALQGVVYETDAQLVALHAYREDVQTGQGGVRVEVAPVDCGVGA